MKLYTYIPWKNLDGKIIINEFCKCRHTANVHHPLEVYQKATPENRAAGGCTSEYCDCENFIFRSFKFKKGN